jgi:pimeloyl-ACP methyl ester carboxylesterase
MRRTGAALLCAMLLLATPPGRTASAAPPAAEVRAYAATALGQVHYRRLAPGEPSRSVPILLIHQTPWYSLEYAHAMPLLAAAGYTVIAPDTPGFGFSPAPVGQPDLPAYADALVQVLDAAGIERAVVVGHHTGAGLAALLAARHPGRAQCVVLHGMPLYTDAERSEKLAGMAAQADPPLSADGAHLSRHFAAIRERIMRGEGSLEGVQASTVSWLIAADRGMRAYRSLFEFASMETALRAIRAPTLLVVDRDDRLLEATRRASRLQSAFRYEELAGGGSHVIFDRPQEWTTMLRSFVEQQCGEPRRFGEKPR